MFHTTLGADRTTLLRLYLILVRSKLDYGAHVYCTASPRALRIQDPVQNEGLYLAISAFRSSPIASLPVEFNVLPLDLHRELLAVKALLPSSPLRSLLASEDLANSSWKFALLVFPRSLDFNVLEFKFTGSPPWTFSSVLICLFLSKLVKASHSISELRYSALEHARVHALSVPIYTEVLVY